MNFKAGDYFRYCILGNCDTYCIETMYTDFLGITRYSARGVNVNRVLSNVIEKNMLSLAHLPEYMK